MSNVPNAQNSLHPNVQEIMTMPCLIFYLTFVLTFMDFSVFMKFNLHYGKMPPARS
jgi:hypothetical protein